MTPQHAPRVVVVVPCYDEEHRLPIPDFEAFLREATEVGFVFVDDGSRDDTLALLRGLEAAAPARVRIVQLPHNRGKAEAVRAGMLAAFESRPDFVGFWDADLSAPLSAIRELAAVLEQQPEVRLAMGARVRLLGRHIDRSGVRHYFGRLAATVISLSLGLPVYDSQCGAKLFRSGPETRKIFEEPFVSGWIFDVEILIRLAHAARIHSTSLQSWAYEYPLRSWREVPGSKVRPRTYLQAALELARLYRSHSRNRRAVVAPPPPR